MQHWNTCDTLSLPAYKLQDTSFHFPSSNFQKYYDSVDKCCTYDVMECKQRCSSQQRFLETYLLPGRFRRRVSFGLGGFQRFHFLDVSERVAAAWTITRMTREQCTLLWIISARRKQAMLHGNLFLRTVFGNLWLAGPSACCFQLGVYLPSCAPMQQSDKR